MDYLWFTSEQIEQLIAHAFEGKPNEVCGILAGKQGRVLRIIPTKNTANDPKHRFEIDQSALARYLPQIESDGLDLLGFYHSHPTGQTLPSPTDIKENAYPNVVQLIIGLKHKQPKLGAWIIDRLQVNPVKIHIGSSPPPFERQRKLSNAQKNAIIITAIIALIIMVMLSINLLPAPPEIPAP